MQTIALRLKPQQDLKVELDRCVQDAALEAACIVTGVGSLIQAKLRFANQSQGMLIQRHFEIVSLVGVMSKHGSHYHLAIADEEGFVRGGHLLQGCLVYTTAEIVIGVCSQIAFNRELDPATGYQELVIKSI